jgi:hypothetical protein
MPSGWTQKRYIGSLLTTGSAIRLFDQFGDNFILQPSVASHTGYSPGTTNRVTLTMIVPTGVVVLATIRFQPAGNSYVGRIYHYNEPDSLPVLVTNDDAMINSTFNRGGVRMRLTNASGQLHIRLTLAAGSVTIVTEGWIDRRMAFTGYE